MLKYFRSPFAIKNNNWNLENVGKILHLNKMKYMKKESTLLNAIQATLIYFYNENLREIWG